MSENDDDPVASLVDEYPNLTEFFPFLNQMNEESPRGAALIACSFIEEMLRRILASFLIETRETKKLLDGYGAPLGTFSARSSAALCLGLITDKEFENCNLLRRIRNQFAHKVHADFNDPQIASLCKQLHFKAEDYDGVVVNSFGQFQTGALGLIMHLTNRAEYVSRERRSKSDYPF